ncbi:hypothetical protein CA13_61210 [Planctomycetes bacterium CA13]|uniref:Uncharacterized protein n=1 Tax=Novipirellula herctigrandis TaxID=2527986 RepID=A0A5C5ZCV7_9BACT|nr:hypothetical protein CA13_61210 [Planctomycetes bacterium CA13]
MVAFFRQDRVHHQIRDFQIVGSVSQETSDVAGIAADQANPKLSIGGQPKSVARATERLSDRNNDAFPVVELKAICRGSAGLTHGNPWSLLLGIQFQDPLPRQNTCGISLPIRVKQHEVDESNGDSRRPGELGKGRSLMFGEGQLPSRSVSRMPEKYPIQTQKGRLSSLPTTA